MDKNQEFSEFSDDLRAAALALSQAGERAINKQHSLKFNFAPLCAALSEASEHARNEFLLKASKAIQQIQVRPIKSQNETRQPSSAKSEAARKNGRKGGLAKSIEKTIAARINARKKRPSRAGKPVGKKWF